MKSNRKRDKQEVTPAIPSLNPNPITHLVGWSNEAPIIIDRQKVIALINLEAQVCHMSSGVCEQMALKVHPLDRLLKLEGTGRAAILHLRYVELNLQIPCIRGYSEDIVLLVIPTKSYAKKVPVIVGSKIIDRAMGIITKEELAKVSTTWRQAHFSVMSGSLQLPLKCPRGTGTSGRGHPLQQTLTQLHIRGST